MVYGFRQVHKMLITTQNRDSVDPIASGFSAYGAASFAAPIVACEMIPVRPSVKPALAVRSWLAS